MHTSKIGERVVVGQLVKHCGAVRVELTLPVLLRGRFHPFFADAALQVPPLEPSRRNGRQGAGRGLCSHASLAKPSAAPCRRQCYGVAMKVRVVSLFLVVAALLAALFVLGTVVDRSLATHGDTSLSATSLQQ